MSICPTLISCSDGISVIRWRLPLTAAEASCKIERVIVTDSVSNFADRHCCRAKQIARPSHSAFCVELLHSFALFSLEYRSHAFITEEKFLFKTCCRKRLIAVFAKPCTYPVRKARHRTFGVALQNGFCQQRIQHSVHTQAFVWVFTLAAFHKFRK